jgi:hypothetical protein
VRLFRQSLQGPWATQRSPTPQCQRIFCDHCVRSMDTKDSEYDPHLSAPLWRSLSVV